MLKMNDTYIVKTFWILLAKSGGFLKCPFGVSSGSIFLGRTNSLICINNGRNHMKTAIKIIGMVLISLALLQLANSFAQDTPAQVQSISGSTTLPDDQPDSVVRIAADAQGLQLVPPDQIPGCGTFWIITGAQPFPPYPFLPSRYDLTTTPVFSLGPDGQFLVDATGGAVPQPTGEQALSGITSATLLDVEGNMVLDLIARIQGTQANSSATMNGARAMDVPSPGDGGSDTNSDGGSFSPQGLPAPDYGTNLWIANFALSSGNAVGIVSNTIAGVSYEIQAKQDLLQSGWNSKGFIIGSELTNWTAMNVTNAVSLANNLFLRIRSWASSDGSGLPNWWELQYFGTTGVDPDAQDPAGDGWTIWQDFVAGYNPTVFHTPPAPQGVTAQANPNNPSQVTLTWLPAQGVVTGYTIVRIDFPSWQQTSFNVGVTNQFVDTSFPPYAGTNFSPSIYEIQADYAGGSSSWNYGIVPFSQTDAPYVVGFPGSQGSLVLLVTHIPPGVSTMRLIRDDGGGVTTNMVFPVSNFTNGIFTVPAAMTFPGSPNFYLQAVWPNGTQSAAVFVALIVGWVPPSFIDGRTQLVQNVSFLLRAASLTGSFSYSFVNSLGYDVQVDQPNTYSYASYYDVYSYTGYGPYNGSSQNWQLPFDENYRYRNFLYLNNTNLNSSGFLNTGCSVGGDGSYSLPSNPVFQFVAPTNSTTIPALDQSTYMQPYTDYQPLGIYVNGSGRFALPNNVSNWFGLHLSSVLLAHSHNGTLYLDTLSSGGTFPQTNDTYYFYPQFDQPQLQTVGYYFGRMDDQWAGNQVLGDPLPGEDDFSPTNPTPLLIAGMGQPVQIAAFAKQIISNGDTSKPVYVAQYFDKAYKLDTNGNVTATQTGVLSPWGDFFPTEPGPVALVTLPDINTGQRGTGVVYVVSLQLDANHDGNMDLSYFGPDCTPGLYPYLYGYGDEPSLPQAFSFWVNNGSDKPGNNGQLDQDVQIEPNLPNYSQGQILPNSSYGQIRCQRNLENFARLWVCGLPNLPTSQGYAVTLGPYTYNTSINLYAAYETNGGTGYLTDTNIAAAQIGSGYGNMLAHIGDGTYPYYTLPVDNNGQPLLTRFLFEGVNPSAGNLALTISQNGQTIAQAFVYLNLQDIKNLYEQAEVTNVIQTWPEMVQQPKTSGFEILNSPPYSSYDAQQLAVFVHGWRMTEWDYEDFSDTMFKRLYWQGYQGRFASLRWPTRSADTDTNNVFGVPEDKLTFNRSEHIAFESGTGAGLYFYNLRQRFTNYIISACAHSQGNIVMMEALKELAGAGQSPLDNYVMMQAAVPAHCYDTTVTNLPSMLEAEANIPTPNTYANYAVGITNALRGDGRIANFYNPIDFALATGSNTLFTMPIFGTISMSTSWEANESSLFMKPLILFGYSYNPTNQVAIVVTNFFTEIWGVTNLQTRIVTDPLELMPFVARPRSKAAGAQGGIGQMVNGGQLDLTTLGFTAQDYDHSGEFNRNIQNPVMQLFYPQLISKLFPPQ
jgi:hypothetical protein